MSFNWAGRPLWISCVPDFQLFVISNSSKNMLIKVIPGYIFNYWTMRGIKWKKWFLSDLVRVSGIDVPNTSLAVIRSWEEESLLEWVPSKTIAFLGVTNKPKIWLDLVIYWCFWVLKVVKNVNLTICSFGGNNFLILRHVTSLVNFALMIDLNIDRDTSLLLFCDTGATDSVSVVVQNILFIVSSVFWWFKWDFHLNKT